MIIRITSDGSIRDKRNEAIYSEVICDERKAHHFEIVEPVEEEVTKVAASKGESIDTALKTLKEPVLEPIIEKPISGKIKA